MDLVDIRIRFIVCEYIKSQDDMDRTQKLNNCIHVMLISDLKKAVNWLPDMVQNNDELKPMPYNIEGMREFIKAQIEETPSIKHFTEEQKTKKLQFWNKQLVEFEKIHPPTNNSSEKVVET
jgi:hypothetical protein